jgi:hypothetical protein
VNENLVFHKRHLGPKEGKKRGRKEKEIDVISLGLKQEKNKTTHLSQHQSRQESFSTG